MASNPPYQVEDQTDEDFFDKLVNEDDDSLGHNAARFEEGNDSDDARAFANLTVGEDSGGEAENGKEGGKDKVGAVSEAINACVSQSNNDSLGFDDSVMDSSHCNREGGGSEVGSDLNVNKSTGSVKSGVKEVGWGSFYAKSGQNEEQGFDFFNELGDSSSRDFPGIVEETAKTNGLDHNLVNNGVVDQNFVSNEQYQGGGQDLGASVGNGGIVQDVNDIQYWENMYPGWKYDANSGQWYQVDGYEGGVQGSFESSAGDCFGTFNGKSEVSYLQQSTHSLSGTVTTVENGTTERVANWNQVSQSDNGYPEHMVFDPQYPGWYYDTIALQWYTLESYNSSFQSSIQSTIQAHDQQDQNGYASIGGYTHNSNSNDMYSDHGQADNYGSQHSSWDENHIHYNNNNNNINYSNNQGLNMWQPGTSVKTESVANSVGNPQLEGYFHSKMSLSNHEGQQKSFDSLQEVQLSAKANQGFSGANGVIGLRSFVPNQEFNQQLHQRNLKENEQMHFSNDFYVSQNPVNVAQQPFHGSQQFPYVSDIGRSSAGRPPHALVSFGFGGKLIVMKDASSIQTSLFSSQGSLRGTISVLNLLEAVNGNTNGSGSGLGTCDYFRALCQQSFPGPLVGGSVGSKELNKWIDDRITNCESPEMAPRKEVLRLLLSLLKIACQHYGKLRSPFGSDTLKESDTAESAVAKLFASAKRNSARYGALSCCLQQLPSEELIRATASELQNLLVSGKKYEALQCAQEGQLWGPALVLASQLGDQFYVDTVKQMALRQLSPGSPLRTLCLLIAGQPAEVFSQDSTANGINMSQQPAQFRANCMLDGWEENLAVIMANRTKDDELVLIHLGDCLWRERSEITAAHICYLVAEANFESYSDSARLCLIGADHWKFPRTYASPEAIQRTELYEYSKVLGNSQFILLPFQPYKLIYAHMLAEVGRNSDSLKYCQAALKSLKTGRTPEVETWKQLLVSLEERIRIHQQGGYAANLAPGKLVGKLLNFVVGGGLPPTAPSTSVGNSQGNELRHQLAGPRVSSSQSTMAMSSLMPSASMEPISQWAADGNKMTIHNRSVSEPDFGRSPRQVDSSMEVASSSTEGKASGGASRFGHFGFGSQLLQKTVGLVLRPRADKQAKLGEKNKFYYDEKLKRWVEEGAEAPAEEAALAPPPTTAAFQNGMHEYNLNSALKNEGSPTNGSPKFRNTSPTEHASGIPPIPTSSNQFTARGRMGVRARYVDTFNKGGGNQANQFQSPALSSVKPAAAVNAKFFIPASTSTAEQTTEVIAESTHDVNASNGNPSTSIGNDSFQSPSPSTSMTMQRVPSMDTIAGKGSVTNNDANGFQSHPRRRGSWGGSFGDTQGHPNMGEMKPQGEVFGMPPSFMPSPMNGSSNFGDDLHEVEL